MLPGQTRRLPWCVNTVKTLCFCKIVKQLRGRTGGLQTLQLAVGEVVSLSGTLKVADDNIGWHFFLKKVHDVIVIENRALRDFRISALVYAARGEGRRHGGIHLRSGRTCGKPKYRYGHEGESKDVLGH